MANTLANDYEIAYNSIIADYEEYEDTLDIMFVNNPKDQTVTKEKFIMLYLSIEIIKSANKILDLYRSDADSKRNINWEDVKSQTIRGFTVIGRVVKNMMNIRYSAFGKLMTILETGKLEELEWKVTKSVAYWWEMITSDFTTLYDRYSRLNEMYEDGYTKFRFYTEEDLDVCDECGALHGLDFPLTKAIVGINLPPIHAWCRCWILPIK